MSVRSAVVEHHLVVQNSSGIDAVIIVCVFFFVLLMSLHSAELFTVVSDKELEVHNWNMWE